MKPLRPEVIAAWELLKAIQASNRLTAHQAFRKFAMMMVEQQPDQRRIVVAGQVLMTFPNKEFASKAHYVQKMSAPRAWLDDAAIYTAMNALGYQTVTHLANTTLPPYVPYVEQSSETPLRFDLVNHGATSGGFHWERKGQTNPGNGDCGAYACAQQIAVDMPAVAKQLDSEEVAQLTETLAANEGTKVKVTPAAVVREDNVVTREVVAQFKAMDQQTTSTRKTAAEHLESFSTKQLAALWDYLMNEDGDYLKGRINEFKKETGGIDISKFIANGDLTDYEALEDFIKEEMVHALSVEAGRSTEASKFIMDSDNTTFSADKYYAIPVEAEHRSCRDEVSHTGTFTHQPLRPVF